MCKARIGLIWVILGWSVPLLVGLGCEFIAYAPDMIALLNALWLPVLLAVLLILPFALIAGGYFWKARATLLPEFTVMPRQTIAVSVILPVFLLTPFLFFGSYLADTSIQNLAKTGVRLIVPGTMGTVFVFISLLELSLVMWIAKHHQK